MLNMPVEKLRLRPWLESMLDSGKIPGVTWVERRNKVFKVSWKHASRHGWELDKDACIFRAWAVHTGRFRQGLDKPDPRRWKANFRCALNALPDIKELPGRAVTRGNNAYKVYQMLHSSKKPDKSNNKKSEGKPSPSNCSRTLVTRARAHVRRRSTEETKECVIRKKTIKLKEPLPLPMPTKPPIQAHFTYWPIYPVIAHAHLKDHDYLTTWYDPRPEMKDIGVMTSYTEIKVEPSSPTSTSRDNVQITEVDKVPLRDVKQEREVPSDEEIVDLVDSMSRDSECSSPKCDSISSYEDFSVDMRDPNSPVEATEEQSTTMPTLDPDDATELDLVMDEAPPILEAATTEEILQGLADSDHKIDT